MLKYSEKNCQSGQEDNYPGVDKMKALVTGAGGFLGSKITQLLLEKGHSVKGIARNTPTNKTGAGSNGESRGVVSSAGH